MKPYVTQLCSQAVHRSISTTGEKPKFIIMTKKMFKILKSEADGSITFKTKNNTGSHTFMDVKILRTKDVFDKDVIAVK